MLLFSGGFEVGLESICSSSTLSSEELLCDVSAGVGCRWDVGCRPALQPHSAASTTEPLVPALCLAAFDPFCFDGIRRQPDFHNACLDHSWSWSWVCFLGTHSLLTFTGSRSHSRLSCLTYVDTAFGDQDWGLGMGMGLGMRMGMG